MRLNSTPPPPPPPPPPPRLYRVARLIFWNALLIAAGLGLIGIGGEAWLRLTKPFVIERQWVFVPGVGPMFAPGTAVRWTNHQDFWTTEQTNSLGFLDAEPVSPERAASSCHISIIGDSFVAALHVPVADKFQVRLAQLAKQRLPDLDLTAAAYGLSGSGQFNQLPLYDRFVRPLNPNLVVLVFVPNDLENNSPLLSMVYSGIVPGRNPYLAPTLSRDGTLQWHSPDPNPAYVRQGTPLQLIGRALHRAGRVSWFAQWLARKYDNVNRKYLRDILQERRQALEIYRQHYDQAGLLDQWQPASAALLYRGTLFNQIAADTPAPAYQQAATLTGMALGEFQARAARDGAALVILSEITMGSPAHPRFNLLRRLAAAHGIPVINLHDYILRRGGGHAAAFWDNDGHWNPQGHQWAAEALLEWLGQNREVCETPPAP